MPHMWSGGFGCRRFVAIIVALNTLHVVGAPTSCKHDVRQPLYLPPHAVCALDQKECFEMSVQYVIIPLCNGFESGCHCVD